MVAAGVAAVENELKTYNYDALSPAEVKALLQRPRIDFSSILSTVGPIVEAVRAEGDEAVKRFTAKFDRVDLTTVCVPINELPVPQLPAEITSAFDIAYNNIRAFHEAQQSPPLGG